MDTPPSPPPPPPPPPLTSKPQPQPQHPAAPPTHRPPSPIPLASPLRTHPKRGLPPTLASTYPHGHISGHPRTPAQQAAFDARRAEILRSMGTQDIEKAYEDAVGRVRAELDEGERRARELEGEMEKLRMEREMERRVWGKLRGLRGGGG